MSAFLFWGAIATVQMPCKSRAQSWHRGRKESTYSAPMALGLLATGQDLGRPWEPQVKMLCPKAANV